MALYADKPEVTEITQPTGGLNLFCSDVDPGSSPVYRVQKAIAIAFWAKGKDLPPGVFGVCAVDGTHLHRGQVPAAHHAIIRRSAGVTINDWQNLLPVCSEGCHHAIENDAKNKEVMDRYYLLISEYHLEDSCPTRVRGRNYLFHWIRALQADGRLDERQPYNLP
jgi:hypothetical protein